MNVFGSGWVRVGRCSLLTVACAVALAGGLNAQGRDSIPGVTLGLVYETAYSPALALKPFSGRFGGGGIAPLAEAIIGRDLRNSDRFQVMDSLPAALLGEGIDYALWDRLGAVWLLLLASTTALYSGEFLSGLNKIL